MPRRICAMRRWYRSGAFPVHRHSLVQLLVDGGLVALAYMLAFELRFDNGIPRRYDLLRDETILWVVPLCIVVFAAFGLYQRLWTYVGQRDYEALLRAVDRRPRSSSSAGSRSPHPVEVKARNGVAARRRHADRRRRDVGPADALPDRRRALPRAPRVRGPRRARPAHAQGRAHRADRRRRRRRPPRRARADAQPGPRPHARRLRRRRPAQARHEGRAPPESPRHDLRRRTSDACSTRSSPTR